MTPLVWLQAKFKITREALDYRFQTERQRVMNDHNSDSFQSDDRRRSTTGVISPL
jgi:hypothetical protein